MKRTVLLLSCAALLLAGVSLRADEKAAGNAEKGKEQFEEQSCGGCHNVDSDEKKMGPGLKGLFKKEKLSNGKKMSEESVREVINKGGNGMPAYEELATEEQRTHIMAYLKTL